MLLQSAVKNKMHFRKKYSIVNNNEKQATPSIYNILHSGENVKFAAQWDPQQEYVEKKKPSYLLSDSNAEWMTFSDIDSIGYILKLSV